MKSLLAAGCFLALLLCACAASRPDHFYILSAQPQGTNDASTTSATQVWLRLTLPSLVDRSEMILNTSTNGVTVLEHERWAAPLGELMTQTLARDLERRRSDLLVAGPSASRPSDAVIKVTVDVVQLTVQRGGQASIEAHWRILDPRTAAETVGSEIFKAPLAQSGYAAVPQALSDCLGLLADRLAGQMR